MGQREGTYSACIIRPVMVPQSADPQFNFSISYLETQPFYI